MENSNIGWTNHTANPWIGCTKVSPACEKCYAAEMDDRYGYTNLGWGKNKPRKYRIEKMRQEVEKLNREAEGLKVKPRVFCASLADVFDPEVPNHWRKELYSIIRETPNLDYLLLTKRSHLIEEQLKAIGEYNEDPLDNVWLGFTAENQEWFDKRWEHHSKIPAKIKFLSYEPARGPIKLPKSCRGKLDWLIIGGETTSKKGESRPMKAEWVRSIKEQCEDLGISFFFKQWGNDIPVNGVQKWFGKTSKTFREQHDVFEGKKYQNFPITK